MINNWEYHSLYMDYSSMYSGTDHPSDIDLFYLGKDGVLILGEIKNERGELMRGQRKILELLADGWSKDAIVLFIQHDKYYQDGDRVVNVPDCEVKEIYYKSLHEWRRPRKPTTVREIIDFYRRKERR